METRMGRRVLVTAVLIALATTPVAAAVPTFKTTRLYSEAEFAAAIKPYTEAIARNANDADAYRWLGVAYYHLYRLYKSGFAPFAGGYGAKAAESLERSAQLRPEPAVLVTLAELYIAMGRPDLWSAMVDRLRPLAIPITPK
jgi:tetratricopeptide (TPR) repeat protein